MAVTLPAPTAKNCAGLRQLDPTYLLAAILEEFGLAFTHWHFFDTFYDDYTDAPLAFAWAHPDRFRIGQPAVGLSVGSARASSP